MKITSKILYSKEDFIIDALCILGVGVGIVSTVLLSKNLAWPLIKSKIRKEALEDLLEDLLKALADQNTIIEKDESVTKFTMTNKI